MTVWAWLLILFVVYLMGARITYVAVGWANGGHEDSDWDEALRWPFVWFCVFVEKLLWDPILHPFLRLLASVVRFLWKVVIVFPFTKLVGTLDWTGERVAKFMYW